MFTIEQYQPVKFEQKARAQATCRDGCCHREPDILVIGCTPRQISEDRGITWDFQFSQS